MYLRRMREVSAYLYAENVARVVPTMNNLSCVSTISKLRQGTALKLANSTECSGEGTHDLSFT